MAQYTAAILQLLSTKGLGRKGVYNFLTKCSEFKIPITDAITASPNVLKNDFKLKDSISSQFTAPSNQQLVERLLNDDVSLITINDKKYPKRLKATLKKEAPPVLFAKGNLSLLSQRAVGFCGARDASPKGLNVAQLCAKELVRHDVNITSGYARGVDMKAHTSALAHGGTTTIVLAEGITHFKIKKEISEFFSEANSLVISEFHPETRWFSSNAMIRNNSILGLSNAMIVIESAMKGGTFAAANQAISNNIPLFFADYQTPTKSSEGNQYFLSKGANAIRANRHGVPNLDGVLRAIDFQEKLVVKVEKPISLLNKGG